MSGNSVTGKGTRSSRSSAGWTSCLPALTSEEPVIRHEDIPEINNPKIRFPVLEGDKLMKEVLNGGYNVHPVPPPNSEIKERIRKRYEREMEEELN